MSRDISEIMDILMELSYNELEEVLAALKEIKGLKVNEIHKIPSKNPNAFQN